MTSPVRDEWLSLTPEPEHDLPRAIATLRVGGVPDAKAIEAERERAEQIVLRGNQRRWKAWLGEVSDLARADALPAEVLETPEVLAARELVLDVINNHDALQLGLPGKHDDALFERVRAGVENEKGRT